MEMHRRSASIVLLLLAFIAGCTNYERIRNEQVLKEDLYNMRTAIDQYTQDKGKAPQHLSDLVTAGYLHTIPKDPFTNSSTTWVEVREDVLLGAGDPSELGITDVQSGSDRISSEGTRYSSW
jgi:general secretion pathway protein G